MIDALDSRPEHDALARGMRLPALFLGHGNPMNALMRNGYTEAWRRLGETLPRPKAILAVSAHWYVPEVGVTATPAPRTIHDFGGFPRELYKVQYPAPGDRELARRVQGMLAPIRVALDDTRGLDHGTWAVLCHVYPHADVPIVQLSVDETQPGSFHYDLGKRLAPLRDEGVLLLGSGNIVHNLHAFAWGGRQAEPYDWAVRFEQQAKGMIAAGDYMPLVDYEVLGRDAMLAIPTPDHFLPLLYVLGSGDPGEPVTFPVEGVDGGSVSMLAVQIG